MKINVDAGLGHSSACVAAISRDSLGHVLQDVAERVAAKEGKMR